MDAKQGSRFLAEIEEHPRALRDLVAFYGAKAGRERLADWARRARVGGRALFAGMGTSEFVADLVLPVLAAQGLDATTADAGEWLHYPRLAPPLAVLVSQSGESHETVRLAERLGPALLVAVVNDEESTLARQASLVLPLLAGDESAISTKTYANSLALVFLLAQALAGEAAIAAGLAALGRVADGFAQVDQAAVARAADLLADARAISFIARGPALVAARQAALTFMEGTRTPAAAFTGGAFRHGPFELLDPDHRAVVFIPAGATAELLAGMAREMVALGGRVVAITDTEVALPEGSGVVLCLPAHGEALFPLAAAPSQEYLLHAVAARRGVEAGVFRHGGKVTRRE